MSKIPDELRYTKDHEWARLGDDGTVTVGISDHAQDLLGDLVFVELPAIGSSVTAGKECAVVESVKAATDVYAPVSGEVVETNGELVDAPDTVNSDPYGSGWMFRVKPTDSSEHAGLLDAKAYEELVAAEEH
ncbi:MAG: glycine cleavage system protein GcvH [Gammaproteobacteria bacterium]|jgi:glycine cleavage system H protein|nr:glycine cleavage system protein GcvH [Gammaproteobacteria bacterium]TDJ68246.1 MAG: glycine cleavage system protein GcvH [Pseudomonadota bacterium]